MTERVLTQDSREQLGGADTEQGRRRDPGARPHDEGGAPPSPRDRGVSDAGRTSGGGSLGHRQPDDVENEGPIRNNP